VEPSTNSTSIGSVAETGFAYFKRKIKFVLFIYLICEYVVKMYGEGRGDIAPSFLTSALDRGE
jgi:hypothetical protein